MTTFRTFVPAADPGSIAAAALPKVCVVTGELVGPFKNGGLGTSMTGLAELLGAWGAETTVLYTGEVTAGNIEEWRANYARTGIRLRVLADYAATLQVGPMAGVGWTNAWHVHHALMTERFDIVHFNDTVGEGVYAILAKRLGLAYPETLLTLAVHSPTEWILESNGHIANWLGFTCFTTAERLSIGSADLVWGPSRYLLGWLGERGYPTPAQTYNQQYVIPTGHLFEGGREKCVEAATPPAAIAKRTPKEIVFFGRLEERKGIRLFTAAVTKLGPELAKRGVKVLFMGKPSSVNGTPADQWLAGRSGAWPFEWRMESGFGQREAVAYLRETDCVAVMASPVDNSPCTVYEALQFGIPFLAAKRGGIPELIHPDDQDLHLFDYKVADLARAILRVLDEGVGTARPAIPVAENQARWLAMHQGWRDLLPSPKGEERPRPGHFAVIVEHAGTAEDLALTLAGARRAFGHNLAKIVVLRRELSPLGEEAGAADVLVVDETMDETPAELIEICRAAGAEALLFTRAGVSLKAQAGSVLPQALARGPDAVIAAAHIATVDAVLPSLAGSAAQALLEGEWDTGVVAVRMDAIGDTAPLDRTRLYFGLVETLHRRDAAVWPVPLALAEMATGDKAIVPVEGLANRVRAYAGAPTREVYQMVGVGHHVYRICFPAVAPAPKTFVENVVSQAFDATAGQVANNPKLREMAKTAIKAVAGDKGVSAAAALVRRLRGG